MQKREIGTPFWQESRKMWRLKVERNGQKKWFSSKKPGAAGRRAVERKAAEWVEGLEKEAQPEAPTVAEAYAAWLEETRETVGIASYKMRESKGRNYILPRLGDIRVDELTTEAPLQDIINHAFTHSVQGKKQLAHKTLQNIRGVMTGFLKYCRKHGWTTLRPEFLDLPKRAKRPQKKILQPHELQVLFTSDESRLPFGGRGIGPDELIHMYRFHVLTGLRPGEVIALQWGDIRDGWVTIQRSINDDGDTTEGKNANSQRSFLMPKRAAAEIEAQRQLMDALGVHSDYVFPDTRTGNAITQPRYRRRFQTYCRHNGLHEYTPYELRHTWYSMNKALPVELVKQMGGHSEDMDTFGVYGHEMEGEREQFAEMLDGVMDGILGRE